jgi:hypothetical protein
VTAGTWQEALLGAAVMAPREVPRARSVLALLARFAAGQGVPASPAWLLDCDVVEAFCVRGCAGRAPSACGTCRSVLYQLAGQVHGGPGQRATPFAGANAPPPYSAAARAGLAAVARAQRGPAKRVLGAGDGGVRDRGGAAAGGAGRAARQRRGPAGRPCDGAGHWRAGAARGARRAAVRGPGAGAGPGCGRGFVFCPGPADRAYKNFVNVFAARLAGDPGAPALSMSRARPSFRCDHLAAGTPLPALLAMAGIAEAESLARHARHVPGMASSKAALRARWHAETAQ